MKSISLYQFLMQKEHFAEELLQNKIIIYPTDTLYGIGAIFTAENVYKINKIKKSNMGKKLSIIAPSFKWIFDNFKVKEPEYLLDCFNKHHGVTFILQPKNHNWEYSLYENTLEGDNTIGVRIIKHPMQEFVSYLGKPIISTSANLSGMGTEEPIKNTKKLDKEITKHVDYIVDGRELPGKASTLIFVDKQKVMKRD